MLGYLFTLNLIIRIIRRHNYRISIGPTVSWPVLGILFSTGSLDLAVEWLAVLYLIPQTRLLRVLAESEFYRVGGQSSIKVNVRVIAATNQDLARAVKESRFREDLYHRLNVIRIVSPPLRERRVDIPMLVKHYLEKSAEELDARTKAIDADALDVLQGYDWPGNVRQLVNATRRLTVTAPGTVITTEDIPADLGGNVPAKRSAQEWTRSLAAWAESELGGRSGGPLLDTALPDFERTLIQIAMSRANGRRQDAAKMLGWGRNTLARKMKALHLE